MLLDVKYNTFVGMDKWVEDYLKRVQLLLYDKHGITVTQELIKTIITYFLKNVVVLMYHQIPIKIKDLFKIRIYPKKNIKS